MGAASEGLGFREPLFLEGRQGERIGATISAALDADEPASVVPLRGRENPQGATFYLNDDASPVAGPPRDKDSLGRARRLYEQERGKPEGLTRLGAYVRRCTAWPRAGLSGRASNGASGAVGGDCHPPPVFIGTCRA